MASDSFTKVIRGFRFRLACVLALRQGLRFSFAWIMIWAGTVVALRAAFLADRRMLLWGAFGLLAAVAVGAIAAIRKVPSASILRAVLDRHGALGGLLMAAGDLDIGPWTPQIAEPPMPALRCRFGRLWILWTAGVGFLVVAFLMPDRSFPAGDDTALQISGDVQKLAEQLQVLNQQQIVPPERVQVLEKDLAHIRKDALGKDPAKTMEAIDHLTQSFRKTAAEAAESAIRETEAASREKELVEGLRKAQRKMDPKQFGEAMKSLARLTRRSTEESKLLNEKLSDALKEACQRGELSESQLEELSEALAQCKAGEIDKLAKLVEARLIDAADLERCEKAGESDEASLLELAEALRGCKDGKQLAELLAARQAAGRSGRQPGQGGISRGRADAAMTWSKGTDRENAAFKEKVLPPGAVASLNESRLEGISAGAPTAAKPGGGSSGGALGTARAGGGEARTQVILPEHEKAVQRYFDRGKK